MGAFLEWFEGSQALERVISLENKVDQIPDQVFAKIEALQMGHEERLSAEVKKIVGALSLPAAAAPVESDARAQACAGSACPTWPSAVHLEGTLLITTTSSSGSVNATVTGEGTAVWSTMGDAAKPGASLSYTRRHESINMPGEPPSEAINSTNELWQICPQHKQYRNSSGLMTGCTSLPQPCFHRYDPVSLALAACKGWAERNIGTSEHYAGTRCDFAGFHIPGQTGSFDIWYEAGKIVKFQTNTTTTTNPAMLTVTSETITVTSFSDSPDPAIFHSYCKPS